MEVQDVLITNDYFNTNRTLKGDPSEYLEYNDDLAQQITLAGSRGVSVFTIIFSATGNTAAVPRDPVKLNKLISEKILHYEQITKVLSTRQGNLLFQTAGSVAAIEISKIREILGVPVSARIPTEEVTTRFIIRNIEANSDLRPLVEVIEGEKNLIPVKSIRRFCKKGTKVHSGTVLVTCYGNYLPEAIRLEHLKIPIVKFIDSPRQCLRCFRYNHSTKACKVLVARCPICGEGHDGECQTVQIKCSNCQGPHIATDRECLTRKSEGEFLKYKCVNNLTFTEARRRFAGEKKKSYATVTAQKAPLATVAAQKEPHTAPPPWDTNSIQELIKCTIKEAISAQTAEYKGYVDALSRSYDEKLESLNTKVEGLSYSVDHRIKEIEKELRAFKDALGSALELFTQYGVEVRKGVDRIEEIGISVLRLDNRVEQIEDRQECLGGGNPPRRKTATLRVPRAVADSRVSGQRNTHTQITETANVVMQRPPVNSLNYELLTELTNTIKDLEKRKFRGMILSSSSPTVFSAGLDITEMYNPKEERLRQFWISLQTMWKTLYMTPLITIAAINGHAPAGGCLLSISCDHGIMVKTRTSIGLNETMLGIVAPKWFRDVFISTIGFRRADHALQLGTLFSAEEALKINLVNELVDSPSDLAEKAEKELERWLKIPDTARQLTKLSIRKPQVDKLISYEKQELEEIVHFVYQEETQKVLGHYFESLKGKKK